MEDMAKFKCLRCGKEFLLPYNPKTEPQERSCPDPNCKSNSVRRIRKPVGKTGEEVKNRG